MDTPPYDLYALVHNLVPELSEENIKRVIKTGSFQIKKNKEQLLKRKKNLFFILKGIVKGSITNLKGDEKTVYLRAEGFFGGDSNNIFYNQNLQYTFESVGETHVLLFNFSDFEKLAFSNTNFMQWYISILKEIIDLLHFRIESMISLPAKERYLELLNRKPSFLDRVPDRHIADFLGITPVTLSRIITELKKEKAL